MHCPEVLCTLVRALLLHRSLDGSYLCFAPEQNAKTVIFSPPLNRREVNRVNKGYLHGLTQLVFILECGGGFIQ